MSKAQVVCKVSEGDVEAPVHKIQGAEVIALLHHQHGLLASVYLIIGVSFGLRSRV